jgi:hypothetical protein
MLIAKNLLTREASYKDFRYTQLLPPARQWKIFFERPAVYLVDQQAVLGWVSGRGNEKCGGLCSFARC